MEEIAEWLRKPMAKTHSSILQENIILHNLSLKFDLHLCHTSSSISHDSLHHDLLEQSTSKASRAYSLYSQATRSNCSHVQGSLITQAEEREDEDNQFLFYASKWFTSRQ